MTYECGAALRNGRGGHLYSLQKIFGDGKPIQSYTTWSMNDDRQGPYSGRGVPQGFSIKGEWSQYSMQKIARGDLGFSWGLSPRAHGVPSLRPVVTFIDSRGRRLALVLDKTPDSFVVSGSLRWHDLFTVALQHGDVTIVVTAPGSSETRRFVIEQALLDSVERSRMRLQARAAEDLKDYRRRCRAVQTPRIT